MWKLNDVSYLDVPGMAMRACPDYENGFDVCDPLGTVLENLEWRGRSPARVLRRRCRSEGVDRSPYEHVIAYHSVDTPVFPQNRTLSNKSHFTLNATADLHLHQKKCFVTAAENGDYIMAQDPKRHQSYHPGRTKINKLSPPLQHILKTSVQPNTKVEDHHLPKVEELLEKDYDMMEAPIAKQPLKSILNNPLLKSPPPGILKKPKNRMYQDSKEPYYNSEGHRRQRASSESDNLYCSFNYGPHGNGCDGRSSCIKRPKDTNVSYSYGSALANINVSPIPKNIMNYPKKVSLIKEHYPPYSTPIKEEHHPSGNVLRTTAINNSTSEEEPVVETPEATRQPVSQLNVKAAPQAQVPVPVPKKIKTVRKKNSKIHRMKSNLEVHPNGKCSDGGNKSPEGTDITNLMETDALIAEIEKLEKAYTASKALESLPAQQVASQCGRQLAQQPVQQSAQNSVLPFTQQTVPQSAPPEAPHLSSPLKSSAKPQPAKVVVQEKKKENIAEKPRKYLQTLPPLIAPVKKHIDKQMTATSSHAFISALSTTNPFRNYAAIKDAPLEHLPHSVQTCLRSSLFPKVPPYLRFINHDEVPSLKVPMAIQRHLKWKLTSITPIVVKKCITNSGFRLVRSDCDTSECPEEETLDWIGIWGKHMKSIMFRAIKDGQKMNHFPGTFQIGRKDRLWRNLQKLVNKHGAEEFGIMPKTYVLPYDLKLLKYNWQKHQQNKEKWIIKPPASARGTGIKVVSRWTQIPKKRAVVVQRYISKPYLINGSKFDMRLYVLVTSMHPLRIYLYKDGLARFASVKYNDEVSSLNDRYMHLTNYSINRLSKNYTPNEDFAACEGHKWTLQTLFQYLKSERQVNTEALWESMKDLVIKTIISGEASISSLTKANVTSRYNCYELFGVDVLLDEDLKPWLLEVNISPSLHSASPLDIHVKGPLVTAVLNIAQFQVPHKTNLEALTKEKPHKLVRNFIQKLADARDFVRVGGLPYDSRLYTMYLSKEERDKHIIYTNMEDRDMYLNDILSTLTSDDVRHLIQAEDELTQATADMERVFPTKDTFKYLDFLTGPRYYNRLFDAWESRYMHNRDAGIQLLRNLCDIGYHLDVPPVPLKNDVDAPSPPASERASVPSITSAEFTPSQGSLAAGPRTCGDALAHPAVPQSIEPRA